MAMEQKDQVLLISGDFLSFISLKDHGSPKLNADCSTVKGRRPMHCSLIGCNCLIFVSPLLKGNRILS